MNNQSSGKLLRNMEVLFEDTHMLIVNKPAPLLTIPDRFNPELLNVKQGLERYFGEIFTVHRLDKETSGVLVFARTPEAHKHLNTQFEKRKTEKYYWALVRGNPPAESGTINEPIAEHSFTPGKMIVHGRGKASVSHYKLLKKLGPFSLLEVQIETGRTHQVRVHLQYLGCPLAIDSLYGNSTAIYLSRIKRKYKRKEEQQERPLMSRLTLHAQKLLLDHPDNNQRMTFTAPAPKDFNALVKQLEKHLS